MKKVEDFQKTQKLMNEYNELEDKITNYKKEQDKLLTEKNIIKQTYTKGIKKEEYKGYEDFEEKLKRDVDEYHIDPRDLEKEYEDKIQKIDSDLQKVEEIHKFFCNDNNFKVITMEINEMEQAVEDAQNEKNIEIAKMDLKYNELMAEKNYDGALEQRKLKEKVSEKFDKDIKELEDKITEYKKFKELLNEKLKDFTVEDFRTMSQMKSSQQTQDQPTQEQPAQDQPTQGQPSTGQPEQGKPVQGKPAQPENIYSNSAINLININAKEGKAYVTIRKENNSNQEIKELDIEEIFKNKKEIFNNLEVNAVLGLAGVDSRFQKFMARRKINPVIIKALEGNESLTFDYIKAIVNEQKFPFEYKIDLNNSILSKKSNSELNRLALKEKRIEGNEVVGAKRLYKIRNLFKINKNRDVIEGSSEPEKLSMGNNFREDLKVDGNILEGHGKQTNQADLSMGEQQALSSTIDELARINVTLSKINNITGDTEQKGR